MAFHAVRDIGQIIRTSRQKFGAQTGLRYRSLILAGIETLAENPVQRTARSHNDILGGAWLYHLRHVRQAGPARIQTPRHLIAYTFDDETVRVQRILYDAMDLPRHLSGR